MPKDLTKVTSINDMNKTGDRSKTLTGAKDKRKKRTRKRKSKGITKHLT